MAASISPIGAERCAAVRSRVPERESRFEWGATKTYDAAKQAVELLGRTRTLPSRAHLVDIVSPNKHIVRRCSAAGYADLRTPLRGLYQAGSATHGGGGVTGIPGRNVVHQVLADRRTARWRRAGRAS